jgi:uncharacterized protein (TIGR03000 family)
LQTQATVIVKLPADAKLYVDGQEANLTSSTRSFTTPELLANQDYYYTIKTVAGRDGTAVMQSQRVKVRAGKVATVNFEASSAAHPVKAELEDSGAPARFKVRLPRQAKLYVNDVLCPAESRVRSFATPTLPGGRDYAYTLKAEIEINGQVHSESRRVVFQAGKEVDLDFGDLTVVRALVR